MLQVDSKAGGSSGRRERPARLDLERFRIDGDQLVLVFYVHVNSPFAVGHSELGDSAQLNRADSGPFFGVNHRGAVGISIHGKDTLGGRIVNNAVGVFVGFGLADDLEALEIEDNDFGLAPVRDEPAAELGGHGDPVVLLQAGDFAFGGSGIGVDDDD